MHLASIGSAFVERRTESPWWKDARLQLRHSRSLEAIFVISVISRWRLHRNAVRQTGREADYAAKQDRGGSEDGRPPL